MALELKGTQIHIQNVAIELILYMPEFLVRTITLNVRIDVI
jgi:hypothetical protein